MGNAFIDGVAAAVALLLCAILGSVAARKLGAAVWGTLMPVFLFLSTQLGRGVAVLLHSRRIWAGPDAATSAQRRGHSHPRASSSQKKHDQSANNSIVARWPGAAASGPSQVTSGQSSDSAKAT